MGDQSKSYYRIGTAAVVLLVLLRLSLGCHFLYEGVWKTKHPEFSADGFLVQAKGPAAPIFHAMVPDMYGTERLKIERVVSGQGSLDAWRKVRDDSETRYRANLTKPHADDLKSLRAELKDEQLSEDRKLAAETKIEKIQGEIDAAVEQFRQATQPILWQAEDNLEAYLAENEPSIHACFGAWNREKDAGKRKQLGTQVEAWLTGVDGIEEEYVEALIKSKSVEGDKQAENAVKRSVGELKPALVEGVAVEKLLANNVVRTPAGREVLRITKRIRAEKFYQPWNDLKHDTLRNYQLGEEQQAKIKRVYRQYKESARTYLAENQHDIAVYFEALKRHEDRRADGNHGAAHQKERLYDERQKLRQEVNVWLANFDDADNAYLAAVCNVLNEGLEEGRAARSVSLPWDRRDLIDFAVTYGLTAIGLCLLLGLFTRPAAVAGGLFMVSVVLTQPAWPTIYPPDPPVVGHALLINKDFVEMIALFTLAAIGAGRWGGLDFFVENFILRLFRSRKNKKDKEEG
jgi:uncharacterized membrane protein YphA (DoxX/SURF4 family)